MALSDDQRALLRLLAQREEGYEDIAALMGLSVAEVRSRVRGALAELERGGAGGPTGSPGPGLGEATAISEPPTSPEPPQSPEARTSPRSQGSPAPPRPAPASPPPGPRTPRRKPGLPRSRRRLAELLGGALLVVLLVLFATGAVDLGDDDSDSSAQGGAAATVAAGSGKLTQARLRPVDGGQGRGRALFGRLRKQVVLQVVAEGLQPNGAGESYTVWLYRSPKLALRVGAVKVPDSGQLAARFVIPPEVLALVANGAFRQVQLARTGDGAYKEEVAEARRAQRLPQYTGETVLSGRIVGPLASE